MKQQSATSKAAVTLLNNTKEVGQNPKEGMLEDEEEGLFEYKSKVMITETNTLGAIEKAFLMANQISVAKSAKSTDGKMYTGCTEKFYATASAAA